MEPIDKIKAHYNFTSGDTKNLLRLKPVMSGYEDEFVDEFYHYVKNFEEAHRFLKDNATIKRHQDALKLWFLNIFSGEYDVRYFNTLEKVGMMHVKIMLPAHYVNAAFHFVKNYTKDIIKREIKEKEDVLYLVRSVEKILDINLDVFTSSYIEEEKRYFLSQRVESFLVLLANRFSHGFNLVLVIGLLALGFLVIGLFGYDLFHVMDGNLEKGLLGTLGSLLMLWVVIELIDTEIKHLRGGKFAIKVFINVAFVATIREILVTSLKHEAVEYQISLVATVAVLGVVYWLVARAEKN